MPVATSIRRVHGLACYIYTSPMKPCRLDAPSAPTLLTMPDEIVERIFKRVESPRVISLLNTSCAWGRNVVRAYVEVVDFSGNREVERLDPIAGCSNLKELRVKDTSVVSIAPVQHCTRLEVLEWGTSVHTNSGTTADLYVLRNTVSLRHLDLAGAIVGHLDYVKRLTNMETLILRNTDVGNLAPISRLVKLRHLDLRYCDLQSMGPVGNLVSLRTLRLDEARGIDDIRPLRKLVQLEKLSLDQCLNASMVPDTLRYLTSIRVLSLRGLSGVHDISALSRMERLDRLDLAATGVVDASPLGYNMCLRVLGIPDCLSGGSIFGLAGLKVVLCDGFGGRAPPFSMQGVHVLGHGEWDVMKDHQWSWLDTGGRCPFPRRPHYS